MRLPRRRLHALAPLLCCSLALAACRDDLTGPVTHAQSAGGRLWVAVTPPRDLPDAGTWLPFLSAVKGGKDGAAALRVKALRDEARRLRRGGDPEGSVRAEEQAAQAAAGSLAVVPDRLTMTAALEAVDDWTREAEEADATGAVPELKAALEEVRSARAGAAGALARGDTLEAVGHLSRASAAARRQAPDAVALRVFARVEAAVRERALPPSDAKRAARLLGWARDAVLTGDPERAFRRAVYALQLVESHRR